MSVWDYRRYGSAPDPIHKSQLNDLVGDYACPTRFRYERDERAYKLSRGEILYNAESVRGDAATGTAAHETIARALVNPITCEALLRGVVPSDALVRRVFNEELEREIAGRRVEWYDKDRDEIIDDRVAMVLGLLADLHKYVAEVVLVEPAFIARIGAYWLAGHIDLLFRPRSNPTALGIADWKTGSSKPDTIELDHGWEAGVYSIAVHDGYFLDRARIETDRVPSDTAPGGQVWAASIGGMHTVEHASRYIAERESAERTLARAACAIELHDDTRVELQRFQRFPAEIYHVHLGDYVPYQKAGTKQAKRPEDLKFYGLATPAKVKYIKGDKRGPAWLPVQITEHDIPRVEHRVRNVVGMVRMGRFIDQVGERCKRCPFAGDCLTTGYALRGDEKRAAERVLRDVDLSSAAELDVD